MVDTRTFLDQMLAEDEAPTAPAAAPVTTALTVQTFVLRTLLERAAAAVPTRDVMAVLKNFQVHAEPGRLQVVATDCELWMVCSTPLVEVSVPGTIVLPARKMLDILREADGPELRIRVRGTLAAISVGRTTWNLRLAEGLDYPALPDITEATTAVVERAGLVAALHAVRYAACRDANRASLMMIDIRGQRMTACDGARFQQATLPGCPLEIQIPTGALDQLLKLLKAADTPEVSIGDSANHLVFTIGADALIVNKLLTAWHDMSATFLRPALDNKHHLSVARGELLAAIKRVRINADSETSAIALNLQPGNLTISARDKVGNTCQETIECHWPYAARTVVVNHAFLTDMINMYVGDQLHFMFGADTQTRKAPILLQHPGGNVGVTQQMHIDWVSA